MILSEPLPARDNRRAILAYEATEGGAGVLTRLMDNPEAISEVARTALGLMHFDNIDAAVESGDANLLTEKADDACVRGCYRCLLSYFNQPDHEQIDRGSGEVTQLLVDLARGRTVLERRTAPDGASSPWMKAFEAADLPQVDTISVRFAGSEVPVRSARSDGLMKCLIMSIFDSGHLEAVYGGEEGSEEAVLV